MEGIRPVEKNNKFGSFSSNFIYNLRAGEIFGVKKRNE